MSAFRKMRRHKQQLDHEECEQILASARRGVLSVQGVDGYPYGLPMNYVYDNGCIYFHSATSGHKIDAIASCDKASFCVLDDGRREPGDWWWHFRSVIAFGTIRRIEDPDELVRLLRKLGEKYFPADYDIEGDIARNLRRVALLELRIDHLTGKHVREK